VPPFSPTRLTIYTCSFGWWLVAGVDFLIEKYCCLASDNLDEGKARLLETCFVYLASRMVLILELL
jgi:hypothetical protein